MTVRKTSVILPSAVILIVLGAYVGSYYAMVTPNPKKYQNMIGASLLFTVPRYGPADEDEHGVAARMFAPMHWLDRRLRPRTWGGPVPTKEDWKAFHRQGLPPNIEFWEPTAADWEDLKRHHSGTPPK